VARVLGLRWKDVDLDHRWLAVRHTITAVGYEMKESIPKNHQARTIDLDPGTIEQLRAHRERQAAEMETCGPGYQDTGLVFRREDGSTIHPQLFSQQFEAGGPPVRLTPDQAARRQAHSRDHRPSRRGAGQSHQ
jgi:integrase